MSLPIERAPQRTRGRRIARAGCLALAAIVLVPVAIYLVVNVGGMISADRERDRLAEVATQSLATRVPELRDVQTDLARRVGRTPDSQWIEQACDTSTDDAGLLVQNYREVCTVSAFSAWSVADVEEARTTAAALTRQVEDPSPAGERCTPLTGADLPASYSFVTVGTDVDRYYCAGLPTPYAARRTLEGKPLVGRQESALLVARSTRPLLDEDIGCLHWSVIFCDDPFGGDHAFGEAPAE